MQWWFMTLQDPFIHCSVSLPPSTCKSDLCAPIPSLSNCWCINTSSHITVEVNNTEQSAFCELKSVCHKSTAPIPVGGGLPCSPAPLQWHKTILETWHAQHGSSQFSADTVGHIRWTSSYFSARQKKTLCNGQEGSDIKIITAWDGNSPQSHLHENMFPLPLGSQTVPSHSYTSF
jgi:hypothetical protein